MLTTFMNERVLEALSLKIFIFHLSSLNCLVIDPVPVIMYLFDLMLKYFPVAMDSVTLHFKF